MANSQSLQEKMFAEVRQRALFDQAHQMVGDYLDGVFDRNIFPTIEALKDLSYFEEDLPTEPGSAQETLNMLHKYGSPATVAQLGGRYYGFVNGSAVPVGLAAKQLATYWDQNTALQVISPISAKLEQVSEGWIKTLLGLPDSVVAGFVSGTSNANLCALAAARYRILHELGWDVNEQGLTGAPRIRIIAGEEAHASALKAISILGFGKACIEWVATDEQGRIKPEALPELDNHCIVVLQAGNVNSGAFDPFEVICKKARKAGAWVHIDGAFGLWAGAVERLKYLTKGMDLAHSWAVDGHKTLNTPYDSGIVLCADREALVSALHMKGGYLILNEERDGMFFTPEMSRRARAVELWAILRYLGKKGIDEMVYGLHLHALQFAENFRKSPGFHVLNDVVFNQVVVACDTDELTEAVLKHIQEQRICWAGGSQWQNRKVIRVSVCSWSTTSEDIELSVASFQKALAHIVSS